MGKVDQERTPTWDMALWDRAKPAWVPIPAQRLESKLFTVCELSPGVGEVGESEKKFFKMYPFWLLHILFKVSSPIPGGVCECVCSHVCVIVPVVSPHSFVLRSPKKLHFGQTDIVSDP